MLISFYLKDSFVPSADSFLGSIDVDPDRTKISDPRIYVFYPSVIEEFQHIVDGTATSRLMNRPTGDVTNLALDTLHLLQLSEVYEIPDWNHDQILTYIVDKWQGHQLFMVMCSNFTMLGVDSLLLDYLELLPITFWNLTMSHVLDRGLRCKLKCRLLPRFTNQGLVCNHKSYLLTTSLCFGTLCSERHVVIFKLLQAMP